MGNGVSRLFAMRRSEFESPRLHQPSLDRNESEGCHAEARAGWLNKTVPDKPKHFFQCQIPAGFPSKTNGCSSRARPAALAPPPRPRLARKAQNCCSARGALTV